MDEIDTRTDSLGTVGSSATEASIGTVGGVGLRNVHA